jgi:predicted phosphodiesterase
VSADKLHLDGSGRNVKPQIDDACELPEKWWREPEVLRAEYDKHGTLSRIALAHGPSERTLHLWWRRAGFEEFTPGPKRGTFAPTDPAESPDAQLLAALKKLGDSATVEELADHADVSPRRVREGLDRLRDAGYRLELPTEDTPQVALHRIPRPSESEHEILFAGETYRFGIASDCHLNSKHCRLDELHIAYDRFAAEGIETVYNPGDIVAGRGIFRGQDHEILNHTYETQVEFAVENYPERKGIVTRIISGNHDCEGDFGRAGADACLAVCNQRDDLTWDGRYAADYKLPNGALMTMRHPMGGSSYAKSYKPQKFAESFEGGSKPALVLFGHWHNVEWGFHRNIHMLNCGTFEGYGGSLGVRVPLGAPAVGFWIIEMTLADDGSLVRFRPEFFSLFAGRRAT